MIKRQSPVLVPDYIAYHALNLICEEGLSCNVILLDRPRDAFSNERVCGKVGAKETQESGNKQISENEYKAKKESNGDNTLNNVGNKADLSSETEKRNETVLEKGPIREDNKGKDSEQNPQDRDDDYEEEDDYLAYRRKEYEGVVECQLMDGNLKISYNTEKDREKERARIENAKNDQDRKLRYRKGVQLDFDQFYLTIDRSATNTSTVKMIVFESENNTYDIRLRIDPKFGRDLFYYSVIAFQRCYQEQKYDWDDNLKRGNIIPMKEFIQDQLELLSLKGFF
ncbi:hypothetical protein FG386_002867 [Cryptosporidium ryanae]|uniref:uncharacterized protein n=1 Tax=Cryptosporidium ryanae TaxID=515981 RepID=UPI00351A6BE2|nr:hypothetical protein FG386_002867 [Cryptosporidium ryanae]